MSLVVILLYLFLLFNMEKPYMLFFMAPFFFKAVGSAFGKGAGRKLIDLN